MSNVIVSVFNHTGCYAGNINLTDNDVDIDKLAAILSPHQVSESTSIDSKIVTIRPLHGLEVNPEGFYNLINNMLTQVGLVAPDNKFTTGYGNMMITTVIDDSADLRVSTTISEDDAVLAKFQITTSGVGYLESIQAIRQNMVAKSVALGRLMQLSTDWVYERLNALEKEVGIINISSTDVSVEPATVQPCDAPPVTTEPPVFKRPIITNEELLEQERERNRAIVSEVIVNQLAGKPVAVSEAPSGNDIKVYIDIHASDRATPVRVVIELSESDYARLLDEGIVSTLLHVFEGARIAQSTLVIESSAGYLFKVRQAIDSHGVTAKSVTPRTPESVAQESFISII